MPPAPTGRPFRWMRWWSGSSWTERAPPQRRTYVISGLLMPRLQIDPEPDKHGGLSFPRLALAKDVRVECTLPGAVFQHEAAPLGLLLVAGEVDAIQPLA